MYDAQNQRIENIAIEYEQNFRQPPPEPWVNVSDITRGLNAPDKRPNPLDLVISNMINSRVRESTDTLPPCPE